MSGAEAVVAAAAGGVVNDINPRSARLRRMQIRRFRFVAGVDDALDLTADLKRKKPRLDVSPPSTPPKVSWKESGECTTIGAEKQRTATGGAGGSCPASSSGPSEPVAAGSVGSDPCPRYGITSVCGRRRDMEDTVSVHPCFSRRGGEAAGGEFHFFGVFDGHGCSHVAVCCRDRMHEMVAEELGVIGSGAPTLVVDWKAVLERSFERMDAEAGDCGGGGRGLRAASCRCELQMPKCDHVGSTAVVAVVSGDSIVVANCGDSRAVLCRDGVPLPLSVDHKPDRPDELERIEAAGGRVIYWDGARVLGVLAMSRAIGDGYLKPFVVSEPEVTITERTGGDECLILASDGLWDVVTQEVACDIVRMCLRSSTPGDAGEGSDKACSDAAMLLTKLALARQSADNVSVVVVDLRRRD